MAVAAKLIRIMRYLKSPRLLLILSMSVFGTLPVFVKYIPLPSSEIALYRAMLASVLIGIYFLITKQKINLTNSKTELILLIGSGIAIALNWIFLFEAYKYTSVTNATLSYYFAPVIVTAVCPIIFKERMSAKQIICFIMSTVGIVLITGIGSVQKNDLVGIGFGLLSAALYAGVIIINKFITNVSGINRTFLQFISATVMLTPYIAFSSGFHLQSLNAGALFALITVGLIHTGITYCLYFSAISNLPGQKVAILSYIDPLLAVILSVSVLGEDFTVWQAIGGALILGFSIINELSFNKRK